MDEASFRALVKKARGRRVAALGDPIARKSERVTFEHEWYAEGGVPPMPYLLKRKSNSFYQNSNIKIPVSYKETENMTQS